MTARDPGIDPFLEALRQDLPTAGDKARARARLFAAGALVAGGGMAPGALASGTASSPTGLLAKVLAWPAVAKVGLATGVVAATTLPLALGPNQGERARGPAPSASSFPRPAPVPAQTALPSPRLASTSEEAMVSQVEGAPSPAPLEAPDVPAKAVGPTLPAPAALHETRESASLEGHPGQAPSAAFPLLESRRVAEDSLKEETRLIEQALGALRSGDRHRATERLQEHRQRFPDGLLSRERERALRRLSP